MPSWCNMELAGRLSSRYGSGNSYYCPKINFCGSSRHGGRNVPFVSTVVKLEDRLRAYWKRR